MTVYKVRDPKTGLFQCGGSGCNGRPRWSKQGKTWTTKGHLRQHFNLMIEYGRRESPIDPLWEIVEFTAAGVIKSVGDFLNRK